MSRVVGIDPGEARLGIAISDEEGSIAFPRETVSARGGYEKAANRVREALAGEELSLVVVGLPLRLDGTEGEAARRARELGDALHGALGVAVVYWDERLTTAAAQRSLREMGRPARRQREVVDQSAAALLLQGYLDAKSGGRWKNPIND